ncbi:MAG: hypothetical protein HY303_08930 [Candidatus Wallbacteria bacterium]|nr:hypothetical protein [Candidatus Wallbacteria bacterium]
MRTKSGVSQSYDLMVGATGLNSSALKLFEGLGMGYTAPLGTKTAVCEIPLAGTEMLAKLGDSVHVFLLDIPRLEFAALIPKGDYATLCLLGKDIDKPLVDTFLANPVVRKCLPEGFQPANMACHCMPKLNVAAVPQPYADRMVFIGDCAVNRLYKDGIGGAYRAAKAAATAAVLHGISGSDFAKHYGPVCRKIDRDNTLGKMIFTAAHQIQRSRFARATLLSMVLREQASSGYPHMSAALWDTFTGSAPYAEIVRHSLHPGMAWAVVRELLARLWPFGGAPEQTPPDMRDSKS